MSSATLTRSIKITASSEWFSPLWWVVVAIILGHAPLIGLHFQWLWHQEQYQYFPFVLGAFGWLLWSRWQVAPSRNSCDCRIPALPWVILACGLVLLVCSLLLISPWLAYVSLVFNLAAVFVWMGRERDVEYLWGIWLLLWLMVPLPLGVDERLVRFLQRLSSQLSSTLLDSVGVLHLMSGNVLQLPKKEFFVDEACSGIVSVMSIIACATIYAVWRNRNFMHLVCLVLAGVVWAMVLNVVRICTIAIAYHNFDLDLSTGTTHEILGLILFLLVFLALVSTDYLLLTLLAPIDTRQMGEASQRNVLVRLWNGSWSPDDLAPATLETDEEVSHTRMYGPNPMGFSRAFTLGVPFLIVGLVQLAWMPSTDTPEAAAALERALALDEQVLPAKVGPWIRDSFKTVERDAYSDYGRYSRTYVYRHEDLDGVTATVSLDFPYLGGWHDLCMCYRNSGWIIEEREPQSTSGNHGQIWNFVDGELTKPDLGHACVLYDGFDAHGEIAEPPSEAVLFRPWFRLRRRLLLHLVPQLFQVQVFASVNSLENTDLDQHLQDLLIEASNCFRDTVAVNGNLQGTDRDPTPH